MRGSNHGLAHLAQVLDARVRQHTDQPEMLEFGTIQSDWSLRPDGSNIAIPRGRWLHGGSIAPALQTGDYVAIAWIRGRPCVIDRVVSS